MPRLVWNWTPSGSNTWANVAFLVYSVKTNGAAKPSTNWPVVAVTRTNEWRFTVDPQAVAVWFAVKASNTVSGEVSDFNAP